MDDMVFVEHEPRPITERVFDSAMRAAAAKALASEGPLIAVVTQGYVLSAWNALPPYPFEAKHYPVVGWLVCGDVEPPRAILAGSDKHPTGIEDGWSFSR